MAKVTMPQLGESVAEGTIGKWLKQVGDDVAKYEPLLEVITDKVNAEVPSPVAGKLTKILVQEGETVPNNAEIAIIEEAGAAEADPPAEADAPAEAAAAAPAAKAAPAAAAATAAPPVATAAPPVAAAPVAASANGPAGSDERPTRAPAMPVMAEPMAAVRPCSRRSRRTAGVIRASALPGSSSATAVGAAGVALAAARSGRSSEPAGPLALGALGATGAAAAAGTGFSPGAAVSVAGAGAGVGAASEPGDVVVGPVPAAAGSSVAPAPSSAVSMIAISALLGTVAPSSTRISFRMPANGDGTSALTLSVMTSTRASYFSTVSPGFFSHLPIVPSATLSPSWGIVTLATFAGPPLVRR